MLAHGYIWPSTSPAAAGFFAVKEKNGGICSCIDYQGFERCKQLPSPTAFICPPAGMRSKIALRSAYHPIHIRESDKWKMAFIQNASYCKYSVMPYGLINTPSVFQTFMNEILWEFPNCWVIDYINDFLIFSTSEEEFNRYPQLSINYLYACECEWLVNFKIESVKYLGHIL